MSSSIVCGVDGSHDSEAALDVAARLSDRLGLRLVVAHVAEPVHVPYGAAAPFGGMAMAGPLTVMEETESQREAAERLLEQVVAAAGLADAERRAAVGLPAERLADLADEEEARRRGGGASAPPGSHACVRRTGG